MPNQISHVAPADVLAGWRRAIPQRSRKLQQRRKKLFLWVLAKFKFQQPQFQFEQQPEFEFRFEPEQHAKFTSEFEQQLQ